MSGTGVSKYRDRQIWLPFVNGTDKTIPAMSCVVITGKEKSSGGRTIPKAELTEKDYGFGAQFLHRITYEKDVEPDQTGHFCFPLFAPVLAAFETKDGKPAEAEVWGPIKNKPKLRKNVGGYRVLGKPVKGSRNEYAVLVMAEPLLTMMGQLREDLTPQGEAEVKPYGGGHTYLDEDGFEFKVVEDLDGEIEEFSLVRCAWDPCRSRWVVHAASCGPVADQSDPEV